MSTSRRRGRLSWIRAVAGSLLLIGSLAAVVTAPAQAARPRAGDACGTLVPKAGGGSWRCSFVDNFDGSYLDTSKWAIQDTATTGFFMGDTCFSNDGQRLRLRRGTLEMLAVREATPFVCKTPTGEITTQYRGADISTWGRFSQTYGRFEARIRNGSLSTPGVHNGFWMNPQKQTYGGWPNSGEIDIAEWWSSARPDFAHPSLHYPGRTWDDSGWNCHIGDPSVFHTYTLEWSPTVMRFFYDGQLCYSRSWSPITPMLAPQPFDHPFYISLSQSVDKDTSAAAGTGFPATMTVDYVRAWS